MLHDNLITENFLHHVQKEQSLSPPQANSPSKMNLYHSFRYEQMQHQLIHQQNNNNNNHQKSHNNDDIILDLSRRCNSDVDSTSLTKTPSSSPTTYKNPSSPTINLDNHRKSVSSPTHIQNRHSEISASLLAENLQKFYCQQNLLSTKSLIPNATALSSNHNSQSTLPLSMYPVYYPQIKQEPIESIHHQTQQQKDLSPRLISPRNTTNILLQIPQPISIHNNLLLSKSNAVYPTSQQNLPILPNLSPKSGLKPGSTDIDRMSDASSIPGSPSSSTSITYPKLLNSSNGTATIMQNLNSPSDHSSINNNNGSKPTRPFKAFPRDPLVIAANFAATDVLYDNPRVERYTEYRKRVLEQIRSANGGERTISNPKMRRLNTRNNFNNNNNTNISSDGSYSDSQANNSETEDRANDSSSDNDTIIHSKTKNYDNCNSNDDNININNNNNNDLKSKNKEKNNNNGIENNHNGIIKDAAYYERRRKNNAAAKKSRDRRRIKEDEIAIRAAYLERQNIELLCQLDALKAQLAALTKV